MQLHKIIHIRATILFSVHCLGPQNFCAEWSVTIQVHWSPQAGNSDLLSHISLSGKIANIKMLMFIGTSYMHMHILCSLIRLSFIS